MLSHSIKMLTPVKKQTLICKIYDTSRLISLGYFSDCISLLNKYKKSGFMLCYNSFTNTENQLKIYL